MTNPSLQELADRIQVLKDEIDNMKRMHLFDNFLTSAFAVSAVVIFIFIKIGAFA